MPLPPSAISSETRHLVRLARQVPSRAKRPSRQFQQILPAISPRARVATSAAPQALVGRCSATDNQRLSFPFHCHPDSHPTECWRERPHGPPQDLPLACSSISPAVHAPDGTSSQLARAVPNIASSIW